MVRKRNRRILSGGAAIFIVLFCTLNANAQFTGGVIEYSITGSTGVAGVTMAGLPGAGGQTVVTDQNGYYSATVKYGWTGTVKPVKEGFKFEPASKPYKSVTADMAGEDYMATPITYTIAGKITGAEGVELVGLPGNPITGPDGSYSVTVDYGWSDTVTPTKEGFTFSPASKVYPPTKASKTTENYTASAVKLLITGSVGEAGVAMKGLPGNVISASNGSFSVKVDYNWTGTITPKKIGFEFSPESLPYDNITTDMVNENFTATALTYVVSGTAGMAGVEMKGLPGNPYTDENGYFSANVNYGFTGTVTPTKAGWDFDPASWMLAKVDSDRTQNFGAEAIKVTISGTTRLPGVEMNGLPGNPVTGQDGSYRVTVEYGWSGTVMPLKDGYKFTPESKTYPAVIKDTVDPAFRSARMTFTISGTVNVPGVSIRVTPSARPIVAGPNGDYTATVDYDWSGKLTPTKDGYEFMPPDMEFNNVMASQSGQDFMPTLLQRKISGTIKDAKGQPVADVSIMANNNGGQTITGTAGEFELSVDHGWSGALTPLKEGYTFRPTNKPFARVSADQLNQTIIATIKMFNVSGTVKLGGVPIDGVLITASNGSSTPVTATTDTKGKYSFKLPYGWSGDIAPTKPGIRFSPASAPLINVTGNVVDGQQVAPTAIPDRTIVPPTPTPPVTVTPPGGTPPVTVTPPGGTPPVTVTPPGGTPPVTVTPPGGATPVAPSGALTPDQIKLKELEDQLKALQRTRAAGPPPDPGSALVSGDWIDNDLILDVLPAIAEAAGIPIIPDDTVVGIVTLKIDNQPVDRTLNMVLAGTPYVWKKTPHYYIVASAGLTDPKFAMVAETRRVKLNYITAEAAVGLLSTAFKPYIQAEIPVTEVRGTATTAARVPQTYTVLVTAPPTIMERIIADLKMIDRIPRQVLLKARIVAMSRTDLLNLGVEWGWPTLNVGAFVGNNYGQGDALNDFGGKAPYGISMGYTPDLTFTNSLQLALNLLTVNGEATILSQPQTMAQDGKLATMKVVNEEYYFLTADQQGSFYTSSQLETVESGTTLSITPHIGENDDIMLHVSIEVSDSIARGRETDLPIVTRRTAENNVRILNGGTVALAGLTQDRSVTTKKRTPGLSNLPLVGALFNNSNDTTTTREVAVFVTAHILDQDVQPTAGIRAAPAPNAPTPRELNYDRTPTPVDTRFNPAPAPRNDRFNPAPTRDRFEPAPVAPRTSTPYRPPAPTRSRPTNFQSELRDRLRRN